MPNTAPGWPQFQSASDRSLLIYFADRISLDAHRQVMKLLRLLQSEPVTGVCNLHPAYCSLLVKFEPLMCNAKGLEAALRQYIARTADQPAPEARTVEIPACYGDEFGPDLADVAAHNGVTPEQAIELHSSASYVVYFLGFVPGFAYLGGLPERLATPRLATPRRAVPPGSIAIAGDQTAVYPFATPGGWRLVGRTPLAMFQPNRQSMSLVSIGDHVRFRPISPAEFAAMAKP
jgi:KipI family sensor histidine kinase inhibitor